MKVLGDDLTPEQLDDMYGAQPSVVGIKGESLAAQDGLRPATGDR